MIVYVQRGFNSRYSTFDSEANQGNGEASVEDDDDDDIFTDKFEVAPQGVDPKRGWGYRGVHKVFLTPLTYLSA